MMIRWPGGILDPRATNRRQMRDPIRDPMAVRTRLQWDSGVNDADGADSWAAVAAVAAVVAVVAVAAKPAG